MKFTQDKEQQRAATDEVLKWLEVCWQHRIDGRPIQPDPFYERNAKLTPEVIKDVLGGIETLMLKEFANFEAYHRKAQGIGLSQHLVPPKFLSLDAGQQLAIVQGIDRIMLRYRPAETPVEPFVDPEMYT